MLFTYVVIFFYLFVCGTRCVGGALFGSAVNVARSSCSSGTFEMELHPSLSVFGQKGVEIVVDRCGWEWMARLGDLEHKLFVQSKISGYTGPAYDYYISNRFMECYLHRYHHRWVRDSPTTHEAGTRFEIAWSVNPSFRHKFQQYFDSVIVGASLPCRFSRPAPATCRLVEALWCPSEFSD
jgi:hypothetical protein